MNHTSGEYAGYATRNTSPEMDFSIFSHLVGVCRIDVCQLASLLSYQNALCKFCNLFFPSVCVWCCSVLNINLLWIHGCCCCVAHMRTNVSLSESHLSPAYKILKETKDPKSTKTNDWNESIWQFHLNPTEGTVYILVSNVKRHFNTAANTESSR